MKKLILSIVTIFALYTVANAQTAVTANANHNVTLTLNNQLEVAFTGSNNNVTMAFATPDNYTNGVTADNAASIKVRSNKAYNVTVKAAAADFTSTSATTMPVNNVLFVKEATQTGYVNLTAADQNLLTNQTRGTNTFNVSYKATPGFNYDGGSYTVSVVYTATQL